MQTFMAVMMLSMIFVNLPRASASAQRIVEVLSTEPSIQDTPQAGPCPPPGVRCALPGLPFPIQVQKSPF